MEHENASPQSHSHGGGQERHSEDMMKSYFLSQQWTQYVVMLLGAWLVSSPITLGYSSDGAMTISDTIVGLSVITLGWIGTRYERGWARWAVTAAGIWLLMGPLVFWTPSAGAYANDMLVGMLLVGFSILVPGMPGMRMLDGPTSPPGWSYNPSTWAQRAPIIVLAFVSLLAARYLAAFQLEHIASAPDPFFGSGTEDILLSDVSRAFPISDAGLGAAIYAIELLSTFMGGSDRWRTMPWMVLMFGVLVIPLGVASIVLVILQPLMVGTWCTVCLFTALTMLIMIPFAVDEVVAMGQFMADVKRRGDSLWENFWRGGTMESDGSASPSDDSGMAGRAAAGVTAPWTLALSALIGLGIMAAPSMLGLAASGANHLWVAGPLVATASVIAMAEVIRPVRFANVALALWVVTVAVLTADGLAMPVLVVAGAALAALALPRGSIRQVYAGWNHAIK